VHTAGSSGRAAISSEGEVSDVGGVDVGDVGVGDVGVGNVDEREWAKSGVTGKRVVIGDEPKISTSGVVSLGFFTSRFVVSVLNVNVVLLGILPSSWLGSSVTRPSGFVFLSGVGSSVVCVVGCLVGLTVKF
jgi:hypothetical protein